MPIHPGRPMVLVTHKAICDQACARLVDVLASGTKPWNRWPTAGGHRQEELASLTSSEHPVLGKVSSWSGMDLPLPEYGPGIPHWQELGSRLWLTLISIHKGLLGQTVHPKETGNST